MNPGNRSLYRRGAVVFVLICLSALLSGCRSGSASTTSVILSDATGVHSYSTAFLHAERPISEGGYWIGGSNGGASLWKGRALRGGRLWGDVQTSSGLAYGVDEPTEFGDPTAILAGNWGPDQTVTATVKVNHIPAGCWCEAELRLRTTISFQSITGYEAYCSIVPEHPYCHIARWNGPNGSYWNFETQSPATYLRDGDVIKATVRGTNPAVITMFRNGEQILQAVDAGAAGGGFGAFGPWTSGNPGIGFFNPRETHWQDFGFSSFSATDDTRQAPQVANLR